jgi:hypothetical protein
MQYLCLVYHEEKRLEALTDDELAATVADCIVWTEELVRGGHHIASAGLQCIRTATTVRNRNGKVTITDGPFAETKEFLGGFTLIDARDLNEAIQIASKHPVARVGTVEVRPLLNPDLVLADPLDRKIGTAVGRAAQAAAGRASGGLDR